MLRNCLVFLRPRRDHAIRRAALERKRHHYRHGSMPFAPMHVAQAARDQHARTVALKTGRTPTESYTRLYGNNTSTAWMREANSRFGEHADDQVAPAGSYEAIRRQRTLEQLQGLGDDEPISTSPTAAHHYSPLDIMAHGRLGVYDRLEPPAPYNKLLSRRMAEGRTWPSILGTPDAQLDAYAGTMASRRVLSAFVHPDNMSPSEKRFANACEYWLRRNLRAMPQHIADLFDFSEFMINQCFVSRRARDLYIVWSTLSGQARLHHEPLLPQLSPWVVRTIKRRIRVQPNIPRVHWVYDNGATPTEMPNKLKHQLRQVHAHTATTIEQRVDHLRQLDSVEARLKGIPWFMPYLWSKGRKTEQTQQLQADFESAKAMEKSAKKLSDGFAQGGGGSHVA